MVDKDPEKAIPLFWAAINAGDRVDSALKDMAIVMKQQNRAEEAIEAIKSLRGRCSDQAQESLDNILLDLYKVIILIILNGNHNFHLRVPTILGTVTFNLNWMSKNNLQRCGRLDDQIGLLRHKLYLIQQGLAFNGKRTKTARSQGKKFQVSVEQEATRLLVISFINLFEKRSTPRIKLAYLLFLLQGNLGWALMQQNNYIEAEDAYRRALSIAPDNNKMCNLGICLMKQGRISEAKETLRRVKPAVADGPRGVDSHLKAYERAQQMLKDLESEMMNKSLDRVEQSRLFDTFLGSSSVWQPQPCKEQSILLPAAMNKPKPAKPFEDFTDENIDSNIAPGPGPFPQLKNKNYPPGFFPGNALNVDAPPFYSTKLVKDPNESLKRTRSGNATNSIRLAKAGEFSKPLIETDKSENKVRRVSISPKAGPGDLSNLLPDNDDFEEAILAAVLGPSSEVVKKLVVDVKSSSNPCVLPQKIDKRLKVFQDITLSPSPRPKP